MSDVVPKFRAICTAPAGGCGFRGRGWQGGQTIAKFNGDGPLCFCGSPMKILPLAVRR
jgi:hypothetical protein